MQQSIMLNLVGGKQLKRTHGFILGIFVFSNQQLEFALKTLAPLVIYGKFSLLIGENKDTSNENQ